jgi:predicted  nucleic acid-binding Zn-ribbon protein
MVNPIDPSSPGERARARQLKEKMEGMRSHLGAVRQEREKLKAEISNLASVIADGRQSPALLAEFEKRKRRLNEINEELLASTGNALEAKLREIEEFAMKRLRDIQGLLGSDVVRAKSELAKLHRHHAYAEREQLHGER